MVRSKKAKAKAATAKSRRKAKDAPMTPQSEATVPSSVITGTTVEDGIDETELLNNEEDVKEVGGYQDTGAEVSAGEENANEEQLGQGSGIIATETMNRNEHEKEEAINEENDNIDCFMEEPANITMEVMNCDADENEVGTEVQPLIMLNEVDQWFVTPTELNEVKVLAEENATSGCLGDGNVTVTVGDDVEEINEENTFHKENCGEDTNVDEDRIADDTENEDEEKEEEEEYGEENNRMDEAGEENDRADTHLEDEIHNGGEDIVVGEGNCQGNVKELHVEEEEDVVEAGENNLRIKVDETHVVVEIDGKTTDSNGNKKDVAGEVNCEGVIEQKEEGVERLTKQNIKRSRKRIRTSTIMARSAGKLALKSRDGPSEKKLKQGLNEDPKGHKNGVPNIDNAKNSVAYKNKGKQKVGIHVGDRGGEKAQVNIEEKVGESSKKKTKRLKQKSRSGPLVEESLVKVASEIEGISGSNKKNGLLKTDTKGMIFMCSSKTKPDCYRYKVLGLPAGKREMVENICKGMILFLYDVQKKLLYGIYKAAADGGYDIEPEAFNSKFPAQVRFDIIEDCLPLEEEKFSKVIRANYFTRNKFDCQLNSGQVENLCKLFRASIKDVKSERRKSLSDRAFRSAREKANLKSAPALFVAESPKARRPLARKERHRRERPVRNEVGSLPRRPVRLSQATASSFAYERTLNREVYRGEPSVAHTEIYRQQPLLEPRDTYRRELSLERRDTYSPDKYLEHRGTYRQERLLVPRDLYRVEQPQWRARDSFRQYPVLERDYDLEPLAEHRAYNLDPLADHMDYDLEPLAERRDYSLQPLPERHDPYRLHGSLLDHQEIYRNESVLERQTRQVNLEPRDPYRREREVLVPRRDHSAYSGGVYSTAQPRRARMAPESRAVGLTTMYPSSAEAEPRYYSRRPVYRL
ncbi:calcium-binding protein [Lithospermum erythrorhizon]|uniref:Calcium-binding protein n=1 Tax=Lithospermum erythrorhizon TaxID=34254 RepID=A0AAV3NLQ4_LITER